MTAFLHGIETIETTTATRQIRAVRTAVIGLVGTAPLWAVDQASQTINTPVLISSRADAVKYFGTEVAGYTIAQALRAIFEYGTGIVQVVNVFNPATHKTAVALANHVLDANGEVVLADKGIRTVVVKDSTGVTTYVLNTDYTVDAVNGVVARKVSGAIASGATIKIGYDKPDPTLVVNSDVIGTVDGAGHRTGAQAFLDGGSAFGFGPKILIAPAYSTQDSVADSLEILAGALKAIALLDAPAGTSLTNVLAGRASGGSINFGRVSDRSVLCYPYLNVPDADGNTVLEPYSQHLAGVIASRDDELGYHWSPSNAELLGVKGLERNITFAPGDTNSESNLLNDAGIVTAVNIGGVVRTWGNRSAAWPTDTDPENFINVRRVADVLHESVAIAMLPFIDQPINDALVDAIKASVNRFIRSLIGRGALIDGTCSFDTGDNPPEEIAAGHLTFGLSFMPPTPAERISFKSFIDVGLLSTIGTVGA